jgi:hypothetical protein
MLPRWFQYWRGGFRIKFKFVKTEFHSGRLVVGFAPAPEAGALVPITSGDSYYLHRDLIDIRSNTEYEFTVPYVSIRPYSTILQSIGTLSVVILNPLRAPTSVATSVDVLIEVCALPDFEVASPSRYWPYRDASNDVKLANLVGPLSTLTLPGSAPGSAESLAPAEAIKSAKSVLSPILEEPEGIIEPQGGEPNDEEQINLDRDIPMDNDRTLGTLKSPFETQLIPAQYCVGERVTSVRQMIRRFEPWSAPFSTSGTVPDNGSYVYTIAPWNMSHYNGLTGTSGLNAISSGGALQGFTSTMAACFRFMRGSMRLKVSPTGNSGDLLTSASIYGWIQSNCQYQSISAFTPDSAAAVIDGYAFFTQGDQNIQFNKTNINGALEVEVPFYSQVPYIPTHFDSNFPVPALSYLAYPASTNTDPGNLIVHRAAGDDFEFGYYTGFPPIVTSVVNTDHTYNFTGDYFVSSEQVLSNSGFGVYSAQYFPPSPLQVQTTY